MYRTGLAILAVVFLSLGFMSLAHAEVMLNEVFYNTTGADDPNTMFTELWGTPGTDLSGWTLVGWRSGAQVTLTIADGQQIPADGYFVIGNTSSVPNVDWVCGGAVNQGVDWQNSSSTYGCIGIELRNSDGDLVDQVCYGTCTTTPPNCSDGGSTVPFTAPGQAMARIPDHHDTNDSGVDWQLTNDLTPGAANEGAPCHTRDVTMRDLRDNDGTGTPVLLDTVVVVRGIVNVANHILSDTAHTGFAFQDDDNGVHLFGGYTNAAVVPGDCVVVTAHVGFYSGKTELNYDNMGTCGFAIEPRGHVNPPAPQMIQGDSPMEPFEGMLVRMNNVSIMSGTWPAVGDTGNLVITDGAGTIGLFVLPTTDIDGTPQPQGNFDVVGVMSQYDHTSPYDGYYEIIPRALSDIIALGVDDPSTPPLAQEFKLAGSYPNPFNSTAEIRYEVGSARELSIAIFDVLGREVFSKRLTGLIPGQHTFSWTPTGATGLYLARLTGNSGTQSAKLLYLR
jgi:hypothetical protein